MGFILAVSLLLTFCLSNTFTVFADTANDKYVTNETPVNEKQQINEYKTVLDSFVKPIFGDRTISLCEYMYNLDDSADYIYIEFEDSGYAIYDKKTMVLLEYSLQGSLPYTDSNASKYYAGPTNYLYKNENNQFHNIITGKQIEILETEIYSLANQIRETIVNENEEHYTADKLSFLEEEIANKSYIRNSYTNKSSTPNIDTKNLIAASTTDGYLIPNFEYFTSEPTIGENNTGGIYGNGNWGTCGPIAAQLLLGYNNYYNDRRIIADRFLNGYNDTSNSVASPSQNPNHCTDPMSMTRWTTGTRSEATLANSFYYEMITRIMEPNTNGSSNEDVKNGIEDYLSDHLSSSAYVVDYEVNDWSIDPSKIKRELNAGRPIIISMDSTLGGVRHFVVGYGYQDYTYASGNGTYAGYVVHFGWQGSARTCVWVNDDWCDGYVSLKINHTHSYYTVGAIAGTNRIESKCSTCGHRTDRAINVVASDRYVERVVTLSAGDYVDYYLSFATSGNKVIQTFGTKDACLELYDVNGTKIIGDYTTDDAGYGLNSLISYYFASNTQYILRLKFFNTSIFGSVKLSIIPTYTLDDYEGIYDFYNYTYGMTHGFSRYYVNIYTYEFSTPQELTMNLTSGAVDTYLYIIDPRSVDLIVEASNDFPDSTKQEASLYNDDAIDSSNSKIKKEFDANVPYLVIAAQYNPSISNADGEFHITFD